MLTDILDGKVLTIWKDEDFLFIAFPFCTVMVPGESVEDLASDLEEFLDKLAQ